MTVKFTKPGNAFPATHRVLTQVGFDGTALETHRDRRAVARDPTTLCCRCCRCCCCWLQMPLHCQHGFGQRADQKQTAQPVAQLATEMAIPPAEATAAQSWRAGHSHRTAASFLVRLWKYGGNTQISCRGGLPTLEVVCQCCEYLACLVVERGQSWVVVVQGSARRSVTGCNSDAKGKKPNRTLTLH